MKLEEFVKSRVHVKLRLWLDESFVDVRYNSRTGSTSYAYIEGDKEAFWCEQLEDRMAHTPLWRDRETHTM